MARRRRRTSRRSRSLSGLGAMPVSFQRHLPRGTVLGMKWSHIALGALGYFAWKNRGMISAKITETTGIALPAFLSPQASLPYGAQQEVAAAVSGLDGFGSWFKKVAQKAVAAPVRTLTPAPKPSSFMDMIKQSVKPQNILTGNLVPAGTLQQAMPFRPAPAPKGNAFGFAKKLSAMRRR